MHFVLDNSVVMRWLFADGSDADLSYAEHILDVLQNPDTHALAPGIWPLEVANVVARAEAKEFVQESRSTRFLRLLEDLAVQVDADTAARAFDHTLALARRFELSAYDAAYLELALRESLPLATLDVSLRRAADKVGITGL